LANGSDTRIRAFLEAIKELNGRGERPDLTPASRAGIFSDLLKLFDNYPFLRYQSYYGDPTATAPPPTVPNNIFVQSMSRRLYSSLWLSNPAWMFWQNGD